MQKRSSVKRHESRARLIISTLFESRSLLPEKPLDLMTIDVNFHSSAEKFVDSLIKLCLNRSRLIQTTKTKFLKILNLTNSQRISLKFIVLH